MKKKIIIDRNKQNAKNLFLGMNRENKENAATLNRALRRELEKGNKK